ncbi:hypothetical protein B0H12DRAFT_1231263 [Mycena haematopus]|nr:hypothetical protein B0H12DRAFT_1231263 [Mycena haematopus]
MLGPRSIDSHASSLQHRRSTKLLINRFESLSEERPAPQVATRTPLCPSPLKHSKKDKSPIRQSFRNLFAALKKSSGLRVGNKLEDPNQRPLPAASLLVEDPFVGSTQTPPVPQLTGSLFYLARSPETRPASQCMLPVWTFCSAILKGDTVHLTWPATPSTHSVFLKHCTDVRSRTLEELDAEERALLPGDAVRDLKVFEVLFEGRAGKEAKEKFATTSVRERARWVSAIWDVILPSNGPAGRIEDDKTSGTAGPSRPSTICLDRALPPVPEPPRSPTVTTPVPASPLPTMPESCASPISSKSSSIANLGRLSVVTQRRAQIERNQSPHSPASPCRLYKNSSVIRTRSLRTQTLPQDEAAGRVSPTSILESYGEIYSPRVSPSVASIRDESEKQYRSGSQDESSSHQRNISSAHPPSPDQHDFLLVNIHEMMSGVAQRTKEAENTLNIVQNHLCERTKPQIDSTAITNGLRDIDQRLRSDLPYIMKLLAQIESWRSIETETLLKSAEAPRLDKLDQILEQLKEDGLQRSVQAHQQTDSWLEAFVSGGTAQIQVVAAGVDNISRQLGSSGEKGGNVLAEIRQLIVDGQANDQTAVLRASINNLAALISSESPSFIPQSIAGLIDQQRQEQEGLLRALATELTNEIRGERLRFVDAMKEATAINVQMHVEELKKELAHQVRADLFAYYSNQSQPGLPPTRIASYSTTGRPHATLRMPNSGFGAYA